MINYRKHCHKPPLIYWRALLLFGLIISISGNISAQPNSTAANERLSPQVLASAGGHLYGSDMVIDWTLGELNVQSYHTTAGIYTEGFHQPILVFPKSSWAELPSQNLKIYPNPASTHISINADTPFNYDSDIIIYDVLGKPVYQGKLNSGDTDLEISVQDFSSGAFMLTLYDNNGHPVWYSKFLKLK